MLKDYFPLADIIPRKVYKSPFSEQFIIRMSTLRYTDVIVTLKYDVCRSSHFSCSSDI